MTSGPEPTAVARLGPVGIPRRRLLRGAGAVGLTAVAGPALAGCTRDPSSSPTPGTGSSAPSARSSPGPTPRPVPDATVLALATVEQGLLRLAETALAHPGAGELRASHTRLLAAVGDGHRQHLAALQSPEPTSRPLPPSPSPSVSAPGGNPSRPTGSLAAALQALRTAESAAVTRHRAAARGSVGFASLLYASMGRAAQGYATALADDDPAKPAGGTKRPVLAPWTETEAEQDVLAACHALLYGYKAAVGFVSESSGTGKRMLARLLDHQQLRDRLTGLVIAADLEPVAAEAAYRLPWRVDDVGSATRLARRLELAVQPHLGRFVAATTTPAVHALALDQLAGATASALSWGAGVAPWPGWPT